MDFQCSCLASYVASATVLAVPHNICKATHGCAVLRALKMHFAHREECHMKTLIEECVSSGGSIMNQMLIAS